MVTEVDMMNAIVTQVNKMITAFRVESDPHTMTPP